MNVIYDAVLVCQQPSILQATGASFSSTVAKARVRTAAASDIPLPYQA